MTKAKNFIKGCLIMTAFFISHELSAAYSVWHYIPPDTTTRWAPGPEYAEQYCVTTTGGAKHYASHPQEFWADDPNGNYYSHFVCATSSDNPYVGGSWRNRDGNFLACTGGEEPSVDGTECVVPTDCSAGSTVVHEYDGDNATDVFNNRPDVVNFEGCAYEPAHIVDPAGNYTEHGCEPLEGTRVQCWETYKMTGDQAGQTGSPAAQHAANPDAPTSNETAPTTVTQQDAPLTETDVPSAGDTTVTETKVDTTTKLPFTDVTNTDSKTDVVNVGGENITKTTTTTTTTKADGTVIEEITVEYTKADVTVTKNQIDWSNGTSSSTSKTYPGAVGSETTVTQTNPDGSSTRTVTVNGQGKDGNGTGTGTGEGPGEEDKKEEEENFNGPPNDGAKTYAESMQDFYNRASNSPIGQAANNISTSVPTGGVCSTISIDLYFGNISTDIHCTTWEAVSGVLSVVMMAAWSMLGIFILLSA